MTYCYAVHLELPRTSRGIPPAPHSRFLSTQSQFDSKNENGTMPETRSRSVEGASL